MGQDGDRASERAAVERRMDSWLQAVRNKDVDALMAHYSPDLLVYTLAPPMRSQGQAIPRQAWKDFFASFDGPIHYEVRDRRISHGSDVAFATSVNHIRGTRKDGERLDLWIRVTVGLCKIDGQWMATHEHVSVPIDMTTTKAIFDQAPS
jgi:ketosteroid isomerase-like protein